MSVNAMTEEFEHMELFGKPVLFNNSRIDQDTVPSGWYCYDIRGSDYDPGQFSSLEKAVGVNFAGSILSPDEIPMSKSKDYRPIRGSQNFLGETLTLEEFCKAHGLDIPTMSEKFSIRPASLDETGFFYALIPEQDEQMGAIGHVRIDFGRNGKEFWHTWHPRGPEELNSPEFKQELTEVVDYLRETVLKSLRDMDSFCYSHGGKIAGGLCQNYGYVVETEQYQYMLRCSPYPGDYQAYLNCFDKQAQQMAQEQHTENHEMQFGGM